MPTKFLFFSLLLIVSNSVFAQRLPEKPKPKPQIEGSRFFLGGSFGLWFGNPTYINLSPILGYKITPRLSAGVGVVYQYEEFKAQGYPKLSDNIYGGKIFGRFYIFDYVFLHAEEEVLNLTRFDTGGRTTINSLLVGGGYSMAIGEHSTIVIMGLWNLTETPYTPYTNPIIRIGFNLGL